MNIENHAILIYIYQIWKCYRKSFHIQRIYGKYVGDEKVNDIMCYKYKFTGRGLLAALFGKDIYMWVAKDDSRNYMVKTENHNDEGSYFPKGVVEELQYIKKISEEEWEELIEGEKSRI